MVLEGHQQEIYSVEFSRDGRLIVSGSSDRTVRIWDMTDTTGQSCKVRKCYLPLSSSLFGVIHRWLIIFHLRHLVHIPESDNRDAGVTSRVHLP